MAKKKKKKDETSKKKNVIYSWATFAAILLICYIGGREREKELKRNDIESKNNK